MKLRLRLFALVLCIASAGALEAHAQDRVTQRARGAVPIWEDGAVPEGRETEASVPVRRRALRAAIAEAVAEATRAFVEREDPYLDPEAAVEALGETPERLRYAARYRVLNDLGRVAAPEGSGTAAEYALEVEAQVDLALIRRRLTETQLLLFEAPPPSTEHQVIVLEGDFSYASYSEIRRAMTELGVEVGAHAFSPGRIRLELDSPKDSEDLVEALRGRLGSHVWLDAVGREPDALRVKVVERLEPEPDAAPPAAP